MAEGVPPVERAVALAPFAVATIQGDEQTAPLVPTFLLDPYARILLCQLPPVGGRCHQQQ